MRHVHPLLLAAVLLALGACGGDPGAAQVRPVSGGKADDATPTAPVTLTFDDAWNEAASGPIAAGGTVAIDYDDARLPNCRAQHDGAPNWQITAFVKALPSGKISEAELFAPGADDLGWVAQRPQLEVPQGTTALEVWFENISGHDAPCHEYDSNYGENYRFEVVSDPSLPTITFGDDWSVQEKGTRVAGGELVVVYAPGRMERIAWGPNEYFSFFASAYHCYGYGCCEQDYQHTLNVRFRADTPFESYDIDSTAVALQIPTDATMVELYFHADVTTTTWYCGGAPGPKFTHPPDRFYDSDYGANFRFALQ